MCCDELNNNFPDIDVEIAQCEHACSFMVLVIVMLSMRSLFDDFIIDSIIYFLMSINKIEEQMFGYFAASIGQVSQAIIERYIETQG